MKKETSVAIAFGIILGIILALVITFTTKNKVIKQKKVISPKVTPTLNISPTQIKTLEIIQPTNNYISNKNIINIKGKSEKNSLIIIQSPTAEKVMKTIDSSFSIDFPISLGENLIKITAYQEKNIDEKTIKVYYLKE